MRRQFGLSTVLSLAALVIATSGTAIATTTILITKNSQVAKHVIAGANAPTGDRHNLISGSVGSSDLHAGSVTSTKIHSGAVTGPALATGSVTSPKMKLPGFNSNVSATGDETTPPTQALVSAAGLTLAYTCSFDSSTTGDVHLDLLASSSATGATFNGVALSSSFVVVDTLTTTTGNPASVSKFETYLHGTHVMPVDLEMSDRTAATSASCHIDGLALPSS